MTVMRCKEMIKHEKKRNELTDFDMILIWFQLKFDK